jgi:4-carboxymuconolactone decarboxylase
MDREQLFRDGQAVRLRFGRTESVRPGLSGVPGYQEIATEFVFGSVWARPGLDLRHRMLATLSTLNVLQRLNQLPSYIAAAVALGISRAEVQETLLQGAFLAGFPAATNALIIAEDVLEKHELAIPPGGGSNDRLVALERRGAELRASLGMDRGEARGEPASPVGEALSRLSDRYEFGVLWQRPGLDHKSRALVGLAGATALGDVAYAEMYLDAARASGWSTVELQETLLQVAPYAGFPPVRKVAHLLE